MDAGTLELVELDTRLDFEPMCDGPKCGRLAEWLAHAISCCGRCVYVCEKHYSESMEIEAEGGGGCSLCMASEATFIWQPIR